MKEITYIGGCATMQEFGHKFTLHRKTVTVSDEAALPFMNHPTYRVIDVPDLTTNVTGGGQEGSGDGQNDGSKENNGQVGEQNGVDGQVGEQNGVDGQVDGTDQDSMKKKLMRLTVEGLQQMCTDKGLDTTGTKEELANRILEVQA